MRHASSLIAGACEAKAHTGSALEPTQHIAILAKKARDTAVRLSVGIPEPIDVKVLALFVW